MKCTTEQLQTILHLLDLTNTKDDDLREAVTRELERTSKKKRFAQCQQDLEAIDWNVPHKPTELQFLIYQTTGHKYSCSMITSVLCSCYQVVHRSQPARDRCGRPFTRYVQVGYGKKGQKYDQNGIAYFR